MPRILITGASGFCGRYLSAYLRALGESDIVEWSSRTVDARDAAANRDGIQRVRPDWIFHLAGLTSGEPAELYSVNAGGAVNLMEAVRRHAPEAGVLLVGSAAEYGAVPEERLPVSELTACRPLSANGASKYAATVAALQYAAEYSLNVVVARPFNIIGPGQPSTTLLGAAVARLQEVLSSPTDTPLRIGRLDTVRDFIPVGDVVRAYHSLLQNRCWGEIVNVCSGRPVVTRALVTALLARAPKRIRLELDESLVRRSDVPVIYGSSEKVHRLCGFVPSTTFEETLDEIWRSAAGRLTADGIRSEH